MTYVYVVTFGPRGQPPEPERGEFFEEVAYLPRHAADAAVQRCQSENAGKEQWVLRLRRENHIVECWENEHTCVWLERLELGT